MSIIQEAHTAVGHGKFEKTYEYLKTRVYWESIRIDIINFLDNCMVCSQFKPIPSTFQFVSIPSPSPFHQISVDIIGRLYRRTLETLLRGLGLH